MSKYLDTFIPIEWKWQVAQMQFKARALAISLGAGALLAGTGLTISSAWLITMAAAHPPILVLSVSIVLVRFFGISRSVARYAERLYSHEAVFGSLTALRTGLYNRLTSSSSEFVRRVETSGLVKSVVDNLERAQEYSLRVLLPSRQAVLAVSMSNLIALWIYPTLLYAFLPASIALLFVIPILVNHSHLALSGELEELEDRYSIAIEQGVATSIEAEIYGFAAPLAQERNKLEREISALELKLLGGNRIYQWLTQSLIAATLCFSILIVRSADGLVPVKVSMAIFLPLVAFEAIALWYPNLYQSGKLLHARSALIKLENQFPSRSREESGVISTASNGTIELNNAKVSWDIHFAKPTSFSAGKGDLLVIRGASGVGKTTLAMAMLGLLEYKGSMKISGIEVRELRDIHTHIVPSLQSGHIFNTSIRENLKIARPDCDDAELRIILDLLELQDISLDEIVGEFGRALSGGEAKRLSVARALLSDARIVILDEPTEHLDSELAERLERAISNICRERTLIVITHSGWLNSTKTVELERE